MGIEVEYDCTNKFLEFEGVKIRLNGKQNIPELVQLLKQNSQNEQFQSLFIDAQNNNQITSIDALGKGLENGKFVNLSSLNMYFEKNQITSIDALGKGLENGKFVILSLLNMYFEQNQITSINALGKGLENGKFVNLSSLVMNFRQNQITSINALGKGLENGKFVNLSSLVMGFRYQQNSDLSHHFSINNILSSEKVIWDNEKIKKRQLTYEEQSEYLEIQRQQIEAYKEIIEQLRKQKNKIQFIEKPQFTEQKSKKEEFLEIQNEMVQQYKIDYLDVSMYKEKYESINLIGEGGYGTVEKLEQKVFGENEPKNQQLVVKKLDCNEVPIDYQERELKTFYKLGLLQPKYRKYIIPLKEAYFDQNQYKIHMILPQAKYSLKKDIEQRQETSQYYHRKELCQKLSSALLGQTSLESIGVLHRDIKPDNLLIMPDDTLVLADFGTAKDQNYNFQLTVQVGTRKYWSPEQINESLRLSEKDYYDYSVSSNFVQDFQSNDLYGIGLCFVQAASLKNLPVANSKKDPLKTYNEDRKKWSVNIIKELRESNRYSNQLINILESMIDYDIEKRARLQECLEAISLVPDWD